MEPKGAVLICPGGAFQFRSDQPEGVEVAEALSALGYQSFVVDYRLRPYTQQEGALDLARAVRFVRAHAREYGIGEAILPSWGSQPVVFSAGKCFCTLLGIRFPPRWTQTTSRMPWMLYPLTLLPAA